MKYIVLKSFKCRFQNFKVFKVDREYNSVNEAHTYKLITLGFIGQKVESEEERAIRLKKEAEVEQKAKEEAEAYAKAKAEAEEKARKDALVADAEDLDPKGKKRNTKEKADSGALTES